MSHGSIECRLIADELSGLMGSSGSDTEGSDAELNSLGAFGFAGTPSFVGEHLGLLESFPNDKFSDFQKVVINQNGAMRIAQVWTFNRFPVPTCVFLSKSRLRIENVIQHSIFRNVSSFGWWEDQNF